MFHREFLQHNREQYTERVRAYHQTEAYEKAMGKRKVWIEPLFAEAKQWHGLRRFRLRRLWKVNCEALITASGQNIKRLLQKRGWGRRPVPTGTAGQVVVITFKGGWLSKKEGDFSKQKKHDASLSAA